MEKLKSLREKTGAGMVDCKNALTEAGGDIDKAVDILRKKGIAKANKRGDRETSEGIIKIAVDEQSKNGYIMEINAETDFVVLSEKFQEFANKVLKLIIDKKPQEKEQLMSLSLDNLTIQETIDNLSGVIGEKLDIKRFSILSSNGTVAGYTHLGGKIGVLVAVDKIIDKELLVDLAMQIAATDPRYITSDQVPTDELDKEREIYTEQLKKEGKPESIIAKILEGKINKYYGEVCLVDQEYIKDDSKKIKDLLGDVKIESFVRYSL
ncbi:translation elongation factor Ts [Patescibacteria group bacterium]|nr:translation elongation factor Ts [Patescibacteria group bacterium]MBU0879490.1 translation elongation factor Ts [Patescibacteria group bacterium]MBU0880118.1 translation elongation factor Ts [Patescibacteria group bacterium]MBU1062789.1 translation elongation factor Ts [Patescibacteria group bacterium]MBU1783110.1 translation elongation factor Ts [Patescibacteria group bacterium]